MINGQSLDQIARALKMSVDQEGRPAFSTAAIDKLLNDIVQASLPPPQTILLSTHAHSRWCSHNP